MRGGDLCVAAPAFQHGRILSFDADSYGRNGGALNRHKRRYLGSGGLELYWESCIKNVECWAGGPYNRSAKY